MDIITGFLAHPIVASIVSAVVGYWAGILKERNASKPIVSVARATDTNSALILRFHNHSISPKTITGISLSDADTVAPYSIRQISVNGKTHIGWARSEDRRGSRLPVEIWVPGKKNLSADAQEMKIVLARDEQITSKASECFVIQYKEGHRKRSVKAYL